VIDPDPELLRSETSAAIARARARVDAFLTASAERPAREVVEAFDRLLLPLNGLSGRVSLWSHVHPEKAVRDACEELEQEIAAYATELGLNRGLWQRLAALDAGALADPEERRLLEHSLRDFRRSGVDRDDATRARIQALREELVQIGQEFDRNIVTGGGTFVVAGGHATLDGLPADFLASHPERADGSVELSTDPADRVAILTYAKSAELRRGYYRVVANRAVPENLAVLPRLLAKRHELARLLGYENWADYVTEDKMTGSAAEARRFLERVVALVRGRAAAEYDELLDAKRSEEPGAQEVFESETAHLVERAKRERHAFDSQAVRPYLAYDAVKRGVLATSAALYGVRFVRDEAAPVWHPSVECYDVVDGGERVARFWLDMHPRDDKYKHAAMFHVQEGLSGAALPEAALVCNFPEPRPGDPALLLHDDVTTFFHEFGHLLHHLFAGHQRFLSFSGIATEHDFVEVPSQIYEEWAWSPEVLAGFARHHETGEPIPAELVARLRAAEDYGKASGVLRQMFYALLSLAYYERDPEGLDLERVMLDLKRELLFVRHEEGTSFQASFGHLHGYSALYYTYMWSLVIAKDLFSRFEADPMSTETARAYRAAVLAPGGSRDARDLVKAFLGREYAFEAFERWLAAG
jgi:thimet oligopeptidase